MIQINTLALAMVLEFILFDIFHFQIFYWEKVLLDLEQAIVL